MNTTPPCNGSSLGLLFRQVRDAMWARMEAELAASGHDLNFSQYITLKTLAHGPAGVTELARAAYLHPGAMTRLLDKLEERGLLAREAVVGDRRALQIVLSEAGRAMWEDISPSAQRVHDTAMAHLSDTERSELIRLLSQVRDNLAAQD
ncbi:Transcriptional regulator, MarR family [Lysobacter dokdonensis DS-58]|uniref:Transcriptional regulator, MarR family n=1 Tax=Lysobacter dokdonensis DS-58 TaxID=1300345 RepID=A0A0A2WI31_9GAMM|nr:MarR family transcriptional regulator [Lysobacter dokdonensis]KGQ19846.1 Transcriptional regulator, MarR family [Lysobacter dokdonensis DS-58]